MKEKIVMCLVLATSCMCAQDLSHLNSPLDPAQEHVVISSPNELETSSLRVDTQLPTAQPIIPEEIQIIEQTPDMSQDQSLQELLNVMTPEERAAFEQEAQFLPDISQAQDLVDLENLIKFIEALSESEDVHPSENMIQ